ncbi:MAG: hypothetical protein ACLP59_34725 [Bryobacteraceae bacterium]
MAASNHHDLNGTWVLIPEQSDFAGQTAINAGSLTISDRERHVYVSRTFSYDGALGTVSYSSSLDGNENSTIHEGKTFKTKAKFTGGVLQVTTTQDGIPTVERFSLQPDGRLILSVERPGAAPMTLAFRRH